MRILLVLLLLSACGGGQWNDPYPAAERAQPIFYTAFTERPKHLDPAQAYSENEYEFLANVYVPPLQYHYLKRPYELVPFAAAALPAKRYLDAARRPLPDDAAPARIAYTVYEIRLRPDMQYQPHPAFVAENLALDAATVAQLQSPYDLPKLGTRKVVAADYVRQIKRLVHPQLHTPIAGIMMEYIVGLKDYAAALQADAAAHPERAPDLDAHPLPGVEVVDAQTYRVTLHGKYPQFAYWLAMPFFAPMPAEAERFYAQPGMRAQNLTLDWWPVGSGPYYLAENAPNRRMVLQRNPHYFPERYPAEAEAGDAAQGLLHDAGALLPQIGRVVFTLEKETIPYWNKFLQGYYDASGISSDSFDQAVQVGVGGEAVVTEAMRAQGITLSTSVSTSTMYTGFNWLDPVVGGRSERATKLRRAIAIAVDFEEFVSIFANGRGIPAQSPLPPGLFSFRDGEAGINPYIYDWVNGTPRRKPVAEAQRLLAEAGYPGGVDSRSGQPLVIHLDTTANGVGSKARLDWLRKQFDKLGVQLDVRSTDYNRFQDKIRRGDTQMFYFGWNADYPDPENFLFLLHGAQAKASHGGENAANYANLEYDRLFEQMKNMDNGPARQALIDRMVEIVRYDGPWLWGFHPKNYVLQHAWLNNVKPNVMANNKLKYWRLDPVLRESRRTQWNAPSLLPLGLTAAGVAAGMAWLVWGLRRRSGRGFRPD